MNIDDSDDELDRLLHRPLANLPDADFSATVMARVRALTALTAPTASTAQIEPAQVLAQLQRRRTSAQRAARCNGYGVSVGVVAALATLLTSATPDTLAGHGVALTLTLTLTLALVISAAAVAWPLLSEPDWPA